MNNFNLFNAGMLAKELEDGQYLTTIGKVAPGSKFKTSQGWFTKTKDVIGHQYCMSTHREETIFYNATAVDDASGLEVSFSFDGDDICITQ